VASLCQWAAASYHAGGERLSNERDIAGSAEKFERAAELWGVALYERDAARVELEAAFADAERGDAEAARSGIARALTFSDHSVMSGPREYETWISRASIYLSLLLADVSGTEEIVRISLTEAKRYSTKRPEPYYLLAVLENKLGNKEEARRAIEEALRLKPDYSEALELAAHLGLRGAP
jgi:tetratricopeptide (TPR) repeat protein